MLKITKSNQYLSFNNGRYLMSSLIVNDNVMVDLDFPLDIGQDVFIAGELTSKVEIEAKGSILVNGGFFGTTLVAGKSITIRGESNFSESVRALNTISLEKSTVRGNIISNQDVKVHGDLDCEGNIAAGAKAVFYDKCIVGGRLVAGELIDARSSFSVKGNVKMYGFEFSKYARICYDGIVFVLSDDFIQVVDKNRVFNINEKLEKIASKRPENMEDYEKIMMLHHEEFTSLMYHVS